MKAIGRASKSPPPYLVGGATAVLELFSQIEEELYKHPAIDGKSFRKAVEKLANAANE